MSMTTQTVSSNLIGKETTQPTWIQRLGLFIVFLVCGMAIFVFGSNYFEIFPANKNLTYNAILSVTFLITSLLLKFHKRWSKYWQIAFAFFIASIAFPVTSVFSDWSNTVLNWFKVTAITSPGKAIAKLYEMILVVVLILVLTKLSGVDFGSIYIKRGNLKMGLGFGALVFFNFATSAFLFFAERFTSIDRLVSGVLWGLVFSFANGFMEEVWLRGIFLKRFEPILGIGGSVLLTSIVFATMHGGAVYLVSAALPFMVANTFTLGLACGYLMMKSDSIWGPTLIHAAADFFLFIALLANA
jgi:membrane protease YdiL (CAAX protease family)